MASWFTPVWSDAPRLSRPDQETVHTVPRLVEGECHLWTVPVGSGSDAAVILEPHERDRLCRLRRLEDRRRFVTARALARTVLAGYMGCDPIDLWFGHAPWGRPFIVDPPGAPDFNLSHSGEMVALAVSWVRCGVDVETVQHLPDLEALAASVLLPREKARWQRLGRPARQRLFFRRWVQIEALGKADGRGLGIATGATRSQMAAAATGWRVARWSPQTGYELALVTGGGEQAPIQRLRWLQGVMPPP